MSRKTLEMMTMLKCNQESLLLVQICPFSIEPFFLSGRPVCKKFSQKFPKKRKSAKSFKKASGRPDASDPLPLSGVVRFSLLSSPFDQTCFMNGRIFKIIPIFKFENDSQNDRSNLCSISFDHYDKQ
jgi:hypothetical protein